jgi:hypothetical protein
MLLREDAPDEGQIECEFHDDIVVVPLICIQCQGSERSGAIYFPP